MAKLTPEGRVKDQIKKLLKARDIWYYMPVQNGMGVVGIPDFICCWDGLFLAIEAKAPGNPHTLTVNQKRRIDEILQAEGLALIVDDPAQLEEWLNAHQESQAKE